MADQDQAREVDGEPVQVPHCGLDVGGGGVPPVPVRTPVLDVPAGEPPRIVVPGRAS
jgi:hypothetical protein